jgi:hypothetical protein
MKLPRRTFLHLAAGATGALADRIGARLSVASGALDCWVCSRRRKRYWVIRTSASGRPRTEFDPTAVIGTHSRNETLWNFG